MRNWEDELFGTIPDKRISPENLDGKPLTGVNTSKSHTRNWKLETVLILIGVALLLLGAIGTAFADPVPAYGIDVSHYNQLTDPAAIRANGISFAYVKATEGTNYGDPHYPGNVAALRGAGILVGGYHFADGPNCATEGAHFRTALAAQGLLDNGALVPMLDMEAGALTSNADACVDAFYDSAGLTSMIVYGNLTWWQHYLHPAAWGARRILGWIARYNGDPGNPGYANQVLVLDQHTDKGTVPGIAGYVDRDAIMPGRSLAEIVLGGPTVTAPDPTPAPAPVPTPLPTRTFHVVVRGDTLSRIAASWGVSWQAVAAANGLSNPNRIYPGQRIYRPSGATSASSSPRSYTVRRGDTLTGIAARYRVRGGWPILASANHLRNPNRLYVGEKLVL